MSEYTSKNVHISYYIILYKHLSIHGKTIFFFRYLFVITYLLQFILMPTLSIIVL